MYILIIIAVMLVHYAIEATLYLNPGETYPDIVEIAVGDNVNISCRMNLAVFPGRSSSDLYFVDGRTQETVPAGDITVVNATTVIYMMRNATEQQTSYLCKCGPDAIMDTKVYVGTPPRPVRDFTCRSHDFEYMVCNFSQPPNPLLTQYNLTFYIHSPNYNYNPVCSYEGKPLVVCNTTLLHEYRPHVEHYHYILHAKNHLDELVQRFDVDNFDVMIPAMPGEDFRELQLTANLAQFAWRMPKWDYYRAKGLQWEVILQADALETVDLSVDSPVLRTRNEMHLRLNDLPYAYYWYTLRLRVKVRTSLLSDDLWSTAFVYRFRTAAKRPDRPPRTAAGSFYMDTSETHLRLYWEQLAPYEYNGENFTYIIKEINKNGKTTQLIPMPFETNSAIFPWQRNVHYQFEICSQNHIGESGDAAHIEIFPFTSKSARNHTPRAIHNVYHATNRTYTLTWDAPAEIDGLQNYTVYWCHSKRALQNECKGSIHFEYVGIDVHKFTTKPQSAQQEHSLNLAVSANYIDYNTGMHWTACTVDVNSDLVKMEPEVQAMSSTTVKIQWSPESVCPSILEGYNLTYCEMVAGSQLDNATEQQDCLEGGATHTIIVDKNAKKTEIVHLKPYTMYKIEMFMFSRMKVGKVSDALFVRTLEAAPSPPRQLHVSNVTNTSATISWLPPSQPNGRIRQHIVILNNEDFIVPYDGNDPDGKIVFQLTNLFSFTPYKVYAIAQTVENSQPSNDIHFTTLIGYPSKPGNPIPITDSNNDTVIQWTKPAVPSGRIEFYEVAVTQLYHDQVEHRRISIIVGSTSCRLKIPACPDENYKTTLKVRAVNVANLHEVEMIDSSAGSSDDYDYHMDNDELFCIGGRSDGAKMIDHYHNNESAYRLYKSDWQPGPTYGCTKSERSNITMVALIVVASALFVICLLYVIGHNINKMSNINCTLPPGLDTYMIKNSFPNDIPKVNVKCDEEDEDAISSPHSQRNKEFIYHNEKHHLLASLGNDSGYMGGIVGVVVGGANTPSDDQVHISASGNYVRSHSESSADSLVDSTDSAETIDAALSPLNNANALQRIVEDEPLSEQHKMIVPAKSDYIEATALIGGSKNITEITGLPTSDCEKSKIEMVSLRTTANMSDYITVDSLNNASQQQQPQQPSQQQQLHITPHTDAGGYVQPENIKKIAFPASCDQLTLHHHTPATNPVDGYTTLEELTAAKKLSMANAENAMAATTVDGISGYVTQGELTAFAQHQQQQQSPRFF